MLFHAAVDKLTVTLCSFFIGLHYLFLCLQNWFNIDYTHAINFSKISLERDDWVADETGTARSDVVWRVKKKPSRRSVTDCIAALLIVIGWFKTYIQLPKHPVRTDVHVLLEAVTGLISPANFPCLLSDVRPNRSCALRGDEPSAFLDIWTLA